LQNTQIKKIAKYQRKRKERRNKTSALKILAVAEVPINRIAFAD
jgi:hypothetical protein